ncbi:hypothetical protein GJ496_003546 [Pomphorhynchus laevis]|nr:hypothetical protein GJ496_003546 [Pomphorhynchus laevis]
MKYFKTQRGAPMLDYNGFLYHISNKKEDVIRWRCKYRDCKGQVTIKNDTLPPISAESHTCSSNDGKNAAIIANQNILNRCKESNERFVTVFTSETKNLETKTLSKVTSFENMRDYAKKIRNERDNYTPGPENDIPLELQTTLNGFRFLQYDSGLTSGSRTVSRLKRKATLLYEKASARFSLPVDLDTPNCTLPCETPSSVVNLSNNILSDCEISALVKGLKFSVTKKSMTARDEIDITSELESLCSKLASNFSNNPVTGGVINRLKGMRIEMSHLKGKTLTPKTNISYAEKEAIRGLRDNSDLIISRADKGNCTVVMDKNDYNVKMLEILQDRNTFQAADRDLTLRNSRKLITILKYFSTEQLSQVLHLGRLQLLQSPGSRE